MSERIELQNYLSEYAMEAMIELRTSQEPKDRLHYFDTALEGTTEASATLLQKLYQDIISRSAIDFGQIPESQGALTKFKDYRTMEEAIECLNKLFAGVKNDEIDIMNRLHDQIIAARKDFAFGYQFDVEMIKLIYCTSVCTLMEMINLCILSYTKSLRDKNAVEFTFTKLKKKDLLVIRSAKAVLHSFESGEWNRIMNVVKKDPAIRRPVTESSMAMEGQIKDVYDDVTNIARGVIGSNGMANIKGAIGKVPNFLFHTKGGNIVLIIAGLIALFASIRKLIFYFFKGRAKVSDWMKNEKEFVKACYDSDITSGNNSATTEKKKNLANKLDRLADTIEIKASRANVEAEKALNTSNRENFSAKSLGDAKQSLSGITF